jgi:hypothetical protein
MRNIRVTITLLNQKLGNNGTSASTNVKLGLWKRVQWPLGREEGLVLQQQLHGYLQMLALIQNGFIQ